ncbi:50S ribosomal protein L7 [Actibacterium mucosum KCTC 23349]|uniref:50S ribosomal protein L7 n=1 Tax=Actibacterium mucosum KCTC 23349 TaxID=1454373 RepID=A0A037ZNQ4_9RHOB|nr:RNA-binding protein [Actibacterium mucosum]KAJ57290.1 50S ribosomal protein L7 [Actibacterium mucosum KCTC 23349]
MGRAARKTKPGEPERRCLATGKVQPKAGLIRFVVSPDGMIVPDLAAKLPGRGIWVSADRSALDKAITKRLFARGAKAQVSVPDGLIDLIEAALTRRVIDGVSLARKAGQAVCGYEKVKGWLLTGEAAYLLQASDGSGRGKSKLSPPDGPGSFIGCLNAGEMGLAFGREHVIHGALAAGGLAKRVVEDAAKLTGVRMTDGAGAPKEGTKTI